MSRNSIRSLFPFVVFPSLHSMEALLHEHAAFKAPAHRRVRLVFTEEEENQLAAFDTTTRAGIKAKKAWLKAKRESGTP